ncbi:fimbrillin family protein [uncultured Prevotella sp.]|uniref:fimbrillin family protein n=1 Tax=uncultured Prevotella sp. TaxID=159272 RepID=UPI0027E23D1B|nr:fimbrillin family protein [uncultured Prevotella sp.]
MKKILYSVFMLATMVLAACSSDDTTEPDVKRGMVLKANVEDTNTRATITDTEGTWKFAFAKGDVVKVGNDKVESYYTFTNNGTEFASTDAMQTTAAANWYAYFPGETIDLANQSGDFAAIANKYALAGMTASATTGSEGLTVTMKAKAAVLCIVGVNKGEKLDISVKTADEKYVSGLAAVKNSADFSVQESDTKVSLLSKNDAGVYYVVVPADVKLAVYNGSKLMKSTKEAGLTAGKYYTLKTGETTGKAFATINGVEKEKEWVQLWPGGPKFATENVAEKINFTEACKTGEAYVWGKNWRTPKGEELAPLYKEYAVNTENVSAVYKQSNGSYGIEFTGVQHGYTNNKIFLHGEGKMDATGGQWTYLTSTDNKNSKTWNFYFWVAEHENGLRIFIYENENYTTSKYMVRPVLAE